MAIVYYPKQSVILKRDTVSASYEQIVLNTTPNTILYFGSQSLESFSGSLIEVTASYALSASYAPGNPSISASYSLSGSYVLTASYSTITNFKIATITSSFLLNLNNDTVLVSASSQPIYITLPSASSNTGKTYNIKKIDSSGYNVIIHTGDSSSIDDVNFKILSNRWTNLQLQSNGVQYFIL